MATESSLTDFFSFKSTKPKKSKSTKTVLTPQQKAIAKLREEYESFKAGKTYATPAKARRACPTSPVA